MNDFKSTHDAAIAGDQDAAWRFSDEAHKYLTAAHDLAAIGWRPGDAVKLSGFSRQNGPAVITEIGSPYTLTVDRRWWVRAWWWARRTASGLAWRARQLWWRVTRREDFDE